ncbi:centrosomal protein of 135 kDa [Zerene cesonia]|uniref:centrosomal protein of 135 kDa n=1 Tax=Zerene cesonia TaxID=33412 RepID=UPI0018E4F08F|nr:centrosomal protein of 135 kDa [Zerene cesonia]
MGENYFCLKKKLEELGYNNTLPVEAVGLVECILADLLQTTRSLQRYMDLSKEALLQRDNLMIELEPYKCDNAKLIQENNQLHREIIQLKEEHLKLVKDSQRKIKSLSEELMKKENLISKLQHDVRDLSLRGLCAETLSSRYRSKRKDAGDNTGFSKICVCNDKNDNTGKDIAELSRTIQSLQEKLETYSDEVILLKNQVEHRDNEIIRLTILLEGGRPISAISKDIYTDKPENKGQNLQKQVKDLEKSNEQLRIELEKSLEKQHEAMLRALDLADKNKGLKDELKKMDILALKVEDDCNKRLAETMNEINVLQNKIENLVLRNSKLERDLSEINLQEQSPKNNINKTSSQMQDNEKSAFLKEIQDLVELNRSLQDKIFALSQTNKIQQNQFINNCEYDTSSSRCLAKTDFQKLLEDERKKYERYIHDVQEKLNETMNLFNKQFKTNEKISNAISPSENFFIKDLHLKLCESEQKLLMLKKENDDLRKNVTYKEDSSKNNYKDIVRHLNIENAELSKENISLSQQLSQYKASRTENYDKSSYLQDENCKLKKKIDILTKEIDALRRDNQEHNIRYRDALNSCDKLKSDLAFKQSQIEQLEEENCSYKVTSRTGRASADRLREECNMLKDQLKKLKSELIKEKTLANQIRNIQQETERSTTESQNELLLTQKKLSLAKDTIEDLEKKCKDLQTEMSVLNNDKSNLIENIKMIDRERDRLVLELDQKAENTSMLEQKLKSQLFDINKLENEISDLKRKLNVHKVSEHKISDYESQMAFLNGEILRLTQQYDTAVIENKHLQNSLADANGELKLNKIELEKSRREVDSLKQQLQHYVAEIRRIEELLSQKEADRSDMLEQFASLSVEANILENTNHSLESESASKSLQLQSYISKIQSLEEKVLDKDRIIETQSARIASMTCKINALENEVRLISEEKVVLEQNVQYLKKMCKNLQSEQKQGTLSNVDSELKLYENRIKSLSNSKLKLEEEKKDLIDKISTTENLLSNARREIIELKLALQDATSETKSLQERMSTYSRRESDMVENRFTREELELPLLLDETIHEESNEDDDSGRSHEVHTRSHYTHGSTL